MKEKHTQINIRDYCNYLIGCDDCLVEKDSRLYRPLEFVNLLEKNDNISLDRHCFYSCCECFSNSMHYTVKLGWSETQKSDKQCIAVVYW